MPDVVAPAERVAITSSQQARGRTWAWVVGALCWLLSFQEVIVQYLVASAWPRPYNYWDHYISDLGNTICRFALNSDGSHRYICSPWHQAINASFITLGVLVAIGVVLTWRSWPRRPVSTAGLVLVGTAAVGVVIIGLEPENVHFWVHALTGFVTFPAQNIGMILLGIALLDIRQSVGVFSVSCGSVGLVATALYFSPAYLDGLGVGVLERLAVDPAVVWLVVVGVWLAARSLPVPAGFRGNVSGYAPIRTSHGREGVTPMANELDGVKVAFLAAPEGTEQVELTEPWQAVQAAGGTPTLVSTHGGEIQAFNHLDRGDTFSVDHTVTEVSPDDYDALVLPGGVANPDALRTNEHAVRFARGFFEQAKPVAVICHGPWTLVEADVVRGREMTSWPSLQTDLRNAGATWVDQEVVADRGLVSSRKPDDLPAFCAKLVEEFAGGRHARARSA